MPGRGSAASSVIRTRRCACASSASMRGTGEISAIEHSALCWLSAGAAGDRRADPARQRPDPARARAAAEYALSNAEENGVEAELARCAQALARGLRLFQVRDKTLPLGARAPRLRAGGRGARPQTPAGEGPDQRRSRTGAVRSAPTGSISRRDDSGRSTDARISPASPPPAMGLPISRGRRSWARFCRPRAGAADRHSSGQRRLSAGPGFRVCRTLAVAGLCARRHAAAIARNRTAQRGARHRLDARLVLRARTVARARVFVFRCIAKSRAPALATRPRFMSESAVQFNNWLSASTSPCRRNVLSRALIFLTRSLFDKGECRFC
jgi:hypothetical protein